MDLPPTPPKFDRFFTQLKTWLLSRVARQSIGSSLPLAKMALRIAIAAVLAYGVAEALQWDYPFYAVIAAVIVMGSTSGSTFNSGTQRIIGTVIGAVAGAVFGMLWGDTLWSLGISIFLTIFLTSVCQLPEAAKLAGYVSAIVILSHDQPAWLYAWNRFLETGLGIAAAILVSRVVFPAHAGAELRGYMARILLDLQQLYQLVITGALTNTYDRSLANQLKTQIIGSFQKNRVLWQEIKRGQAGEPLETVINEVWDFLVHRIWEHILTMEHTILVRQDDQFWQMLSPQLNQLAEATTSAMSELATAVKNRQQQLALSALEISLNQMIEQFHAVSEIQHSSYPTDELLRFFTFFYAMEEVGRKLQRMADRL